MYTETASSSSATLFASNKDKEVFNWIFRYDTFMTRFFGIYATMCTASSYSVCALPIKL